MPGIHSTYFAKTPHNVIHGLFFSQNSSMVWEVKQSACLSVLWSFVYCDNVAIIHGLGLKVALMIHSECRLENYKCDLDSVSVCVSQSLSITLIAWSIMVTEHRTRSMGSQPLVPLLWASPSLIPFSKNNVPCIKIQFFQLHNYLCVCVCYTFWVFL